MDSFLIFIIILAVGLGLLFLISRIRQKLSPRDISLVQKEWRSLELKARTEPKQAVIEADKLLDFVLKRKGYNGSLGEKLKKAAPLFSNIDEVWDAHKMRNHIAHEVGFVLSSSQASRPLMSFKKALRDLGISV